MALRWRRARRLVLKSHQTPLRELVGAGGKSGEYWTLAPDTGRVVWVTNAGPGHRRRPPVGIRRRRGPRLHGQREQRGCHTDLPRRHHRLAASAGLLADCLRTAGQIERPLASAAPKRVRATCSAFSVAAAPTGLAS